MVLPENFIPSSFILVTLNNFTTLTFWNAKKNTLIQQLGLLEKNNLTGETGRLAVHWEKGNRKRQKTADNKQSPALLQCEIAFSPEWKTSHTNVHTITYGLLKGLGITFFLYAHLLLLSVKGGWGAWHLICLPNKEYASIVISSLKGQNWTEHPRPSASRPSIIVPLRRLRNTMRLLPIRHLIHTFAKTAPCLEWGHLWNKKSPLTVSSFDNLKWISFLKPCPASSLLPNYDNCCCAYK